MESPPQSVRSSTNGHNELPALLKLEVAQRGIGLDVILLVQATLESEFQFMRTMDLAQQRADLAGDLTLLVVAVWIVSRVGETRRKIIVDEHGGNAVEPIRLQIRLGNPVC